MAQRKTLTDAQVQLLRWIGEGCPENVYSGTSHRVSVAALRGRGLVATQGHGMNWSASITDTGRQYLESVDGPNPPNARQANELVGEQLVRRVVDAGGKVRLSRREGSAEINWGRRARIAEQGRKVPEGKRLAVRNVSWDEVEVELADAPEGTTPELEPVPVPQRVTRYHPAAQKLKEQGDRREVSRAAMGRAMRIAHALAVEGERRGFKVATSSESSERTGHRSWSAGRDGHLVFTDDALTTALRIHEEGFTATWEWDPYPVDRATGRLGPGKYKRKVSEVNATGRLVIELISGRHGHGRTSTWADRTRWTLEDRLPDVLGEITVRSAEERHRLAEEQRATDAREAAWREAMAVAGDLLQEARRAEALTDQVTRWVTTTQIRDYASAALERFPDVAETVEWVSWARERADQLDPLGEPPISPAPVREVRPEELRPFLDGWSPYGAQREAQRPRGH